MPKIQKTELTFEKLRKANAERCEKHFHQISAWSESDWAVALAGEVGELCNMIKKRRRGEDIPTQELAKELGDIVAYADLLATRLGLKLVVCVQEKFDEVSDRKQSTIKLGDIDLDLD